VDNEQLPPGIDDPRFLEAVKLLERTGAQTFRIGLVDEEEPPWVWYAVAEWAKGADAAAALNPLDATFRLCAQVIDGGECTHCGKTSSFIEDHEPGLLDAVTCAYAWDPELKTFRRGCE
jgi:hypothetical protein